MTDITVSLLRWMHDELGKAPGEDTLLELLRAVAAQMAAARGLEPDTVLQERTQHAVPLQVEWAAVDVSLLGNLYTALLADRYERGSYFTPRALADQVVEWVLAPELPFHASLHNEEGESLEQVVRILDPAMGSGHFLWSAADRLAGNTADSARRWAALQKLYGTDSDPSAVELARLTLWLWASHPGTTPDALSDRLVQADILTEPIWDEASFDVVIGNPPYASVFTRARNAEERAGWTDQYETASGSYDLAVPFVERAICMTRPGGRCGLVLPNKLMAADYAQSLRRWLNKHAAVEVIADYACSGVFDADVYPVACVFRREAEEPLASTSLSVYGANGKRMASLAQHDLHGAPGWVWSPVLDPDFTVLWRCWQQPSRSLGEIAEIAAGLTVGEAYDLRESVLEAPPNWLPSGFVPLATTGLIDRYRVQWGKRRMRYLKRTFRRPVIAEHALPPRRREHARRAKLLIAGMGLTPRAALDQGEMLGSVGTLVILEAAWPLGALCAWLNSDLVARLYRALFGGLALSGGYLRFGRRELERLPLPDIDASDSRVAVLDALGLEAAAGVMVQAEIDRLVLNLYGLDAQSSELWHQ